MINITLNKRDFEYDIHSLVKAFYPREEVHVGCGEPVCEESMLKISVFYETDRIRAVFSDAEGNILSDRSGEVPEGSDRPAYKNVLKHLLYAQMKELNGRDLPWGDLTGIRPVKIPMSLIEKGCSDEEILAFMKETYLVSEEKRKLALQIAHRERKLLSGIHPENGYSIYIGIPFCPSICLYCSFSSSPIGLWKNQVDDYLDALIREMEAGRDYFRDKELQTVYIGGGTPTTLSDLQLDRLICALEKNYDLSRIREFTVEAGRPDSITGEKLQVLKDHGISRISINPQTMNQKTLDLIGRRHSVDQIRETFGLARDMGFDNINMDLIIGLPGEGEAEVRHTMQEMEAMRPDSITIHALALKRATRLNLMKEIYQDISFEASDRIMALSSGACIGMGQHPYYLYRQKNIAGNFENVGYAAKGHEGLYNVLIMEEVQSILAFGAGASTKIVTGPYGSRIERIENVKDIRSYIDRIDEMISRKRKIYEYTGEITD